MVEKKVQQTEEIISGPTKFDPDAPDYEEGVTYGKKRTKRTTEKIERQRK